MDSHPRRVLSRRASVGDRMPKMTDFSDYMTQRQPRTLPSPKRPGSFSSIYAGPNCALQDSDYVSKQPPTSYNPKPPTALGRQARSIWRQVWAQNGHLTKAHRAQVERYCTLEQQAAELAELLARESYTARGVKGQVIEHPAARTLRGVQNELRALSRRLALDPTSRARLRAAERAGKPPSPADECSCLDENREPRTDMSAVCDYCLWCGAVRWIADADAVMTGAGPLEHRQPPFDELLPAWLKHHHLDELPEAWQAAYDRQQSARKAQDELMSKNEAAFKAVIRKHKRGHTRAASVPTVRRRRPGRPPIEVQIEPTDELEFEDL
jgi:P27 family predicted phage terminase small subunit